MKKIIKKSLASFTAIALSLAIPMGNFGAINSYTLLNLIEIAKELQLDLKCLPQEPYDEDTKSWLMDFDIYCVSNPGLAADFDPNSTEKIQTLLATQPNKEFDFEKLKDVLVGIMSAGKECYTHTCAILGSPLISLDAPNAKNDFMNETKCVCDAMIDTFTACYPKNYCFGHKKFLNFNDAKNFQKLIYGCSMNIHTQVGKTISNVILPIINQKRKETERKAQEEKEEKMKLARQLQALKLEKENEEKAKKEAEQKILREKREAERKAKQAQKFGNKKGFRQ